MATFKKIYKIDGKYVAIYDPQCGSIRTGETFIFDGDEYIAGSLMVSSGPPKLDGFVAIRVEKVQK